MFGLVIDLCEIAFYSQQQLGLIQCIIPVSKSYFSKQLKVVMVTMRDLVGLVRCVHVKFGNDTDLMNFLNITFFSGISIGLLGTCLWVLV